MATFEPVPDADGFRKQIGNPKCRAAIDFITIEGSRVGLGKSHVLSEHLLPELYSKYDHVISVDDVIVAMGNVFNPHADPTPFDAAPTVAEDRQVMQAAQYTGFIAGQATSILATLSEPRDHTIAVVASRYHLRGFLVFAGARVKESATDPDNPILKHIMSKVAPSYLKLARTFRSTMILDMESVVHPAQLDVYCYNNMLFRGREFEMMLYPSLATYTEYFQNNENVVWTDYNMISHKIEDCPIVAQLPKFGFEIRKICDGFHVMRSNNPTVTNRSDMTTVMEYATSRLFHSMHLLY